MMDNKIKAKAQELRLALLTETHKAVHSATSEGSLADRLRAIQELAGILNQLDPDGSQCGMYSTALVGESRANPQP